jgi:hypothetical protein
MLAHHSVPPAPQQQLPQNAPQLHQTLSHWLSLFVPPPPATVSSCELLLCGSASAASSAARAAAALLPPRRPGLRRPARSRFCVSHAPSARLAASSPSHRCSRVSAPPHLGVQRNAPAAPQQRSIFMQHCLPRLRVAPAKVPAAHPLLVYRVPAAARRLYARARGLCCAALAACDLQLKRRIASVSGIRSALFPTPRTRSTCVFDCSCASRS